MSALSSYLAKNYLTASTPSDQSGRPKKRRKKDKSSTAAQSLVIADDDDLLLSHATRQKGRAEEDEGVPTMYEGQQRSAEFRKKKSSTWKTISRAAEGSTDARDGDADADADEADKILASAAAAQEDRRREIEMEDAPAIVRDTASDAENEGGPTMESGVRAGLQTAADTQRLMEKEEKAAKRTRRQNQDQDGPEEEQETVYRDATGRRIDVSLRRAELRKEQQRAEAAKRKEKEDAMGEVQRRQKEERKVELEDAKFLSLGRGEDDEEMNEQLKKRMRFDDPMAQYMALKGSEEKGGGAEVEGTRTGGKGKGEAGKKVGRVYQGHAPPNRYSILPGWRWDGVDRGNGFEKDWFQARSRSKRNEEMGYAWQTDE